MSYWEVIRILHGNREGTSYHTTKSEALAAFRDWERRGGDYTTIVYDPDGRRHRWHEAV